MKLINKHIYKGLKMLSLTTLLCAGFASTAFASSHREAPLIAKDPVADNTDLYVFRSPGDTNTVTIIANYIPFELPHAGPNYYSFGQNVRYEIHIDNDITTTGDDIIYRLTFTRTNEDPTTFFNIRLGKENLKTTYKLEKSTNGGSSFTTIVSNGIVPPPNIGARSIEGAAGLNTTYNKLMTDAIMTATTGEKVFAGPVDDPFFADLGGIFDLGDAPRQNTGSPRDGVAGMNVHTIAIKIPISMLQKDNKSVTAAKNILDPDFVIGVWASASRQKVRTLEADGTDTTSGTWVQVSRLGMPLTNEVVIPIGKKNMYNALSPYMEDTSNYNYFYNPELALYMDTTKFASAVPGFENLRIQHKSLGMYGFNNGENGLYGLKGNAALAGTALDDAVFGKLLLPGPNKPRSVDLWPIFHTGVPNLEPYQLATGKSGNPLASGKPFINNFLPNGGDMLRLNMAVPVTPRNSADFSTLGLIQAAVLGLTDGRFNTNTNIQNIPNMDGFPNGRRLEDDVTRIELQAVSGVVLAAIGLWYDDYNPNTSTSPVTQDLLNVLTYTTGVEMNDTTFKSAFPYVQNPWRGTSDVSGPTTNYNQPMVLAPTAIRCDAGRIATSTMDSVISICGNATDSIITFRNNTETSADYRYLITNANGVISTVNIMDSTVNLMDLGRGNFRIYGLSSTDTVSANAGTNISAITSTGCFQLTQNFISIVIDSVNAGNVRFANNTLMADTICLGSSANFRKFSSTGGSSFSPMAYIITDAGDKIVNVSMADSFNFATTSGIRRIYKVSYIGNLTATVGQQITAVTASQCFDVSNNFVTVVSDSVNTTTVNTNGMMMDTVCIGSGTANINFANTGTSMLANFAYIVTDASGNIISVSNTNSIDMSTGAAGNRRVYGVSYFGRLNATVGNNISTVTAARCAKVSSNFVTINRAETMAGNITTIGGKTSDTLCTNKSTTLYRRFSTSSTANVGFAYILTNASNTILAVSMNDSVNFAGIANGTETRVYGVSYFGTLNANVGNNLSTVNASRCIDISTSFVTIMVDSCTTVSIRETDFSKENAVTIFPNPAENQLNIKTDARFNRIIITNVMGQIIYENNRPVTGTSTINVADMKPGMYFMSFYNGNDKTVKIFIKD